MEKTVNKSTRTSMYRVRGRMQVILEAICPKRELNVLFMKTHVKKNKLVFYLCMYKDSLPCAWGICVPSKKHNFIFLYFISFHLVWIPLCCIPQGSHGQSWQSASFNYSGKKEISEEFYLPSAPWDVRS